MSRRIDHFALVTEREERPEDESHGVLGKPFRVRAQVRNNRLIRAREVMGYGSAAEAARALGLRYSELVKLESLKSSPWNSKTGDWRECAEQISLAYKVPCEVLWPDAVREIAATTVEVEAGLGEIAALSGATSAIDALEARDHVRALLLGMGDDLSRRERWVLERRFGLDGGGESSLEEVGQEMRVTNRRVWQIEARALRKLRSASEKLKLREGS